MKVVTVKANSVKELFKILGWKTISESEYRTETRCELYHEHLELRGFKEIHREILPECSLSTYANDKCTFFYGYWRMIVKNNNEEVLFDGWIETNEEFDEIMTNLGLI